MHSSGAQDTFILCNRLPFPELIILQNWKPLPIKQLSIPPNPSPGNTILLSVFRNLTILVTSCDWNHAVCVLLSLGYFTWHSVLKLHPCVACVRISFLSKTEEYSIVYCSSPPYQWGQLSRTPRGCSKPQIVLNPIYTVFFPIHMYLPMIKFNV